MEKPISWKQTLPAMAVHVFTATGILAGFMAILAINAQDWRSATAWLFICQIIDGADGTLARRFRVETATPYMDGKTIDQVIDFATYAIIPAYFLYQSDLVAEAWRLPCAFAMLLAAALYYGKKGMVSDDMHFVGFPVMWNVVVFFLFFVFRFSPALNAALIFAFAVLHFVPLRYPYPSRALQYRAATLAVSIAALIAAAGIVWIFPERNLPLNGIVISAMAFYSFLIAKASY